MTFVKVFFSVTRLGHKFSYKRSPNIYNCWAIWKNITFKYNLLWLLFGNVWNILATFDADIRSQLSLAFCHLGQLFLSTPFICFFLCKGTQYIIDTPMPCTEYINRLDVYLKVLLHTSFLLHSLVYGGFSCQWVFYPFLIFNFLYIFLFDRQGSNTFRVNQQKIFDKLFDINFLLKHKFPYVFTAQTHNSLWYENNVCKYIYKPRSIAHQCNDKNAILNKFIHTWKTIPSTLLVIYYGWVCKRLAMEKSLWSIF